MLRPGRIAGHGRHAGPSGLTPLPLSAGRRPAEGAGLGAPTPSAAPDALPPWPAASRAIGSGRSPAPRPGAGALLANASKHSAPAGATLSHTALLRRAMLLDKRGQAGAAGQQAGALDGPADGRRAYYSAALRHDDRAAADGPIEDLMGECIRGQIGGHGAGPGPDCKPGSSVAAATTSRMGLGLATPARRAGARHAAPRAGESTWDPMTLTDTA